jgi:hypothetical protein
MFTRLLKDCFLHPQDYKVRTMLFWQELSFTNGHEEENRVPSLESRLLLPKGVKLTSLLI